MGPLPEVVDLASLISKLAGHPQHVKLAKMALASQRAQSCVADLSLAHNSLEALAQVDQLDRLVVTPWHLSTIQHALIANAAVLYVRATSTHSGGGERGSINITDRLSPDDLADHELLVALRNRVIAHVHSDEAIADNVWHAERMIMREEGAQWLPGCFTRRIQADAATVARLRRMVPIARHLVRATFLKRIDKLTQALNDFGLEADTFADHLFDAVGFFGSEDEASRALSPRPGGSAFGIVRP